MIFNFIRFIGITKCLLGEKSFNTYQSGWARLCFSNKSLLETIIQKSQSLKAIPVDFWSLLHVLLGLSLQLLLHVTPPLPRALVVACPCGREEESWRVTPRQWDAPARRWLVSSFLTVNEPEVATLPHPTLRPQVQSHTFQGEELGKLAEVHY